MAGMSVSHLPMTDLSLAKNLTPYKPTHKVRFVTAAALFDGHDASINIMLVLILVAVFGVVGIGLWGLRQAKVIDENLEYITTNSLPSLGVAAAVESEFLRMRTRIMYHLAHNDPAQKQADEKLIQDHRQKMETLMHGRCLGAAVPLVLPPGKLRPPGCLPAHCASGDRCGRRDGGFPR